MGENIPSGGEERNFLPPRIGAKRVFERKGERGRGKRGETSFANGIYSAEKAEKVGKERGEREGVKGKRGKKSPGKVEQQQWNGEEGGGEIRILTLTRFYWRASLLPTCLQGNMFCLFFLPSSPSCFV